ncbi:MAG: hypothetical protein LBI85_09200 [Spirochaetaceae bacterium]|jgi:tetratricopeptide (TPR) repeat protein|nr:hypothetical protein [Spirochaetaceae bacterium]
MKGRITAAVVFFIVSAVHAQTDDNPLKGDLAGRYVSWAEEQIAQGRWTAALLGLERAGDFADVSSDISYLSALCLFRLDQGRLPILEKLRLALETDIWRRYAPHDAETLLTRILVQTRRYEDALSVLSRLPESLESLELTLAALKGSGNSEAFRAAAFRALERYPREGGPAVLVLDYARSRLPRDADRELVNLVLRRLPLLVDLSPSLAYKAAPFIRDAEEARRLVAAYRASGNPSPLSLPAALNLGLVSEDQAVAELFGAPEGGPAEIPHALIGEIWSLLRTGEARRLFAGNLSVFSGVIKEDEDGDGIAETAVRYRRGSVVSYHYDDGQDGVPDLEVFFAFGVPESASLPALPGASQGGVISSGSSGDAGEEKVWVFWEKYPALLRAELGGTVFFPPPLEFFYAPLRFVPLAGDGTEFLYPRRDPLVPRISARSLAASAVRIERPGKSAEGAVETIEMIRGIPQRARETAGGRLVSETEFRLGQMFLQRLDMDMDGRLETLRRFRQVPGLTDRTDVLDFAGDMESAESDWDGDGLFEYGEVYHPDGSVERSWDLDGDGRRERHETGSR